MMHIDIDLDQYSDLGDFQTTWTTSERNGYPRHERQAIVAEYKSELLALKEKLEEEGYTVGEAELDKRDGWGHWHRNEGVWIEGTRYDEPNEQEWASRILPDTDPKAEAFDIVFGGRDIEELSYDLIKQMVGWMEDIYDEMPAEGEEYTLFYDPDQNYRVERIALPDDARWRDDGNGITWQLALLIDDAPEKEEEEEED